MVGQVIDENTDKDNLDRLTQTPTESSDTLEPQEQVGGKYRKKHHSKSRNTKRRSKKHHTKKRHTRKHNKSKKMNYLTFCKKYAEQHGLPNARSAMSNPNCKRAFHAMKH